MHELALFAGAGGGILGGYLLGWKTVCAVEIEKYPRDILLARQKDGILPHFPIWDDIQTFDGRPWKGRVDIITGGFPCQDISVAGKGEGITGSRSGLWKSMSRVVREVGPEFVLVENSPALTLRGIEVVFGDLVKMGYNIRWCVLGADDTGAPHQRKRIWILAYSDSTRRKASRPTESQKQKKPLPELYRIEWWDIDPANLPDTDEQRLQNLPFRQLKSVQKKNEPFERGSPYGIHTKKKRWNRWPAQSRVDRVVNGMAHRVDRLKAIGNGQVPAVAALAFIILSEGLI